MLEWLHKTARLAPDTRGSPYIKTVNRLEHDTNFCRCKYTTKNTKVKRGEDKSEKFKVKR